MIRFYTIALLLIVCRIQANAWTPVATDPNTISGPRKILFIGNSYTYYNNLDVALKNLALSANPPLRLQTFRIVEGGATLEKHYSNHQTLQKIKSVDWDYVILQEQSMRPLVETEMFYDFAGKFDALIKETKAKTVLYMTWAREDAPDNTDKLDKTFTRIGSELNAYVAPVGRAWSMSLKSFPEILLYHKDKSHPNIYGTYLAACVFYSTLTGQSPVGLSNAGFNEISEQQARCLQETAWKTVQTYTQTCQRLVTSTGK